MINCKMHGTFIKKTARCVSRSGIMIKDIDYV